MVPSCLSRNDFERHGEGGVLVTHVIPKFHSFSIDRMCLCRTRFCTDCGSGRLPHNTPSDRSGCWSALERVGSRRREYPFPAGGGGEARARRRSKAQTEMGVWYP